MSALLLLCAFVALPMPGYAAERVEAVTAQISSEAHIPPLVQERMEKSVAAIAGQLLQGNLTDELQRTQAAKAAIIHEVFDKVLIGYTVERVWLEPGETTAVHIKLLPWQDTIRRVDTAVYVEGMSPLIEAMVREDLAGAETVFDEALLGLPLAATDWTNGILKKRLNEFIAVHLPEFRADFDVDSGEVTAVKLTVYPRLPVIRTIDLSMRSDTLPNLAMLEFRDAVSEQADLLVGVPVAFVQRHEAEIGRHLVQTVDKTDISHGLSVRTHTEITAAEKARITTRSDSDKYRLRLTGWVDVGRRDSDKATAFRLHLGRRLSALDEFFAQVDLYPHKMNGQYAAGYKRGLGVNTQAELQYNFTQHNFKFGLAHYIGRSWRLRYEYRWYDKIGEAGLGYKVHDFLELEYVLDNNDNWLRLIGHF